MSSLKLFLLSSSCLERGNVPLESGNRKNVTLITYLAVTGKRHIHGRLRAHLFHISTAMRYCNVTVTQ